jgi:peptidyl-tRNA hydrolase, PTH1 family
MSFSLVAGLGNPGRSYASTRHNAGFMVVDALAAKLGLAWQNQASFEAETTRWDLAPGHSVLLAKPLTFMNESGRAVQKIAAFHKIPPASIVVVHDDLNLALGALKISVNGSSGGQNGVADLIQRMGENFIRYRVGIGPKSPPQMDLKDFVLAPFTTEQSALFTQNIPHLISGLRLLLEQGPDRAMNQLNRRTQT